MKNEVEFPNIKAMGLYIEHDGMPGAYVSAHDLEKALSEAIEVNCFEDANSSYGWELGNPQYLGNTHKARLVCIQPIVKEMVKTEREYSFTPKEIGGGPMIQLDDKFCGKRVKVTVEELP